MGTSGTPTGTRARSWLGGIVGVAMVASIVWTTPAGQPAALAAPKGPASKPNIVLILTDDQRWDTLQWMPNVQSLLVNHGVTFDNAFVENSLCCPSRASTLTGQHSHQTGVWSNEPPYGGFPVFRDRSTIATWLRDAGYHTSLIVKYLNGYKDAAWAGYKPPGWERWVSFASNNGAHFNYDLTVDGTIRRDVEAFSTDVFANQAVNFIREKQGPLFLYFAPYAPHEPYIDLPERDNCLPLGPYAAPSFGESDVSDKPPYISGLPWTGKEAGTQGCI